MPTIVLADNQHIALRGLRALLDADENLDIIGMATDGLAAVELVTETQPDLLLLDLEMPGLVGFEVAKRLQQSAPDTRIIIYSGHGAWPYVRKAFDDCGAMGYVHKDDDDDCVLKALERVMDGKRYLSPSVMTASSDQMPNDFDVYLRLYDELTDTEKELLHPLAEGYTAAQIAEMRVVEESTIRTHIEHMKDKLNLSNKRLSLSDLRHIARMCTLLNPRNLLGE